MLKGIDISNWQGGINLKKVIKNNDLDFVIVKASEGLTFTDKYMNDFIEQAEACGVLIGFYHFARPSNDPEKEADFFITKNKNLFGKYVPILDLEMRSDQAVAWAYKFLNRVITKTGVRPWLYSYLSYLNTYKWDSVKSLDVALWIAQYKSSGQINGFPASPPSYTKPNCSIPVCAYQFTSKGRLMGYGGDLDLNYYYGDAESWRRYARPPGTGSALHDDLIAELAERVIKGKYGSGDVRKQALGCLYTEVQIKVNELMKERTNK